MAQPLFSTSPSAGALPPRTEPNGLRPYRIVPHWRSGWNMTPTRTGLNPRAAAQAKPNPLAAPVQVPGQKATVQGIQQAAQKIAVERTVELVYKMLGKRANAYCDPQVVAYDQALPKKPKERDQLRQRLEAMVTQLQQERYSDPTMGFLPGEDRYNAVVDAYGAAGTPAEGALFRELLPLPPRPHIGRAGQGKSPSTAQKQADAGRMTDWQDMLWLGAMTGGLGGLGGAYLAQREKKPVDRGAFRGAVTGLGGLAGGLAGHAARPALGIPDGAAEVLMPAAGATLGALTAKNWVQEDEREKASAENPLPRPKRLPPQPQALVPDRSGPAPELPAGPASMRQNRRPLTAPPVGRYPLEAPPLSQELLPLPKPKSELIDPQAAPSKMQPHAKRPIPPMDPARAPLAAPPVSGGPQAPETIDPLEGQAPGQPSIRELLQQYWPWLAAGGVGLAGGLGLGALSSRRDDEEEEEKYGRANYPPGMSGPPSASGVPFDRQPGAARPAGIEGFLNTMNEAHSTLGSNQQTGQMGQPRSTGSVRGGTPSSYRSPPVPLRGGGGRSRLWMAILAGLGIGAGGAYATYGRRPQHTSPTGPQLQAPGAQPPPPKPFQALRRWAGQPQ